MKTQYIKIIKCDNNFWYKKYINAIIEVEKIVDGYNNHWFYKLTDNNEHVDFSKTSLFVFKTDCIILNRQQKLNRILQTEHISPTTTETTKL